MESKVPQYKKEPRPEDIPKAVEQPQLKVCQVVDSVLILPRDLRSQFLHDPCVGPEWRAILAEFDRTWSSNPVPETSAAPSPGDKSLDSPIKAKLQDPDSDFEWASVFVEAPTTFEDLKGKFGSDLLEMAGPTSAYSFAVAPGPELYVIAKEPVELKPEENAITHGAGAWLLGDKGKKFMANNPGRGVLCQWNSDTSPVVLEERCSAVPYIYIFLNLRCSIY